MHPVMWYNKSRKYYEEKEKEKKCSVCCKARIPVIILFKMSSTEARARGEEHDYRMELRNAYYTTRATARCLAVDLLEHYRAFLAHTPKVSKKDKAMLRAYSFTV